MPEIIPVPFRSPELAVEPAWIDYNGHLNLAYYHVLFDRGLDPFSDAIGLGEQYRARTGFTTYTAEAHVRYLKEVPPAAEVVVTTRIVGLDAKRLHLFQEMHHADGWLAATLESLSLSIDQRGETPKVTPFPVETFQALEAAAHRHAELPRPPELHRAVQHLQTR
ncbi:thioesterase family protein [Jiella sp. MQZ9-1]|uniref:Thioesterase family protein n=1 Tax=Jiella flava TaxID=2816857 RepID=A0A939JUR0_9HYPH|nr:thioesterase family protein [Jiella flava]MBO0661222.1 thioesterase family protein [Jiella flava]MCD2469867.1 thioesterase family protein [Jiella flava]